MSDKGRFIVVRFDPHNFWKDPGGSGLPPRMVSTCKPEFYLDLENVTRAHVETLSRYAHKDDSILELGSGTGRNLVGLLTAGFTNVMGVEINADAVQMGRNKWPVLNDVRITISSVEEFEWQPCDVVFTSGLLMHLPPSSEYIFDCIKINARKVIETVEGEGKNHLHVWARKFREVFEDDDWKQVDKELCGVYPPLPDNTVKRVFVRQ